MEKFAENFEQVKFPHDDTGFVTKGTRRVKVYRNAPEVKPPQDEKVLPILYKRPVCSGDNTDYSAHGQK